MIDCRGRNGRSQTKDNLHNAQESTVIRTQYKSTYELPGGCSECASRRGKRPDFQRKGIDDHVFRILFGQVTNRSIAGHAFEALQRFGRQHCLVA